MIKNMMIKKNFSLGSELWIQFVQAEEAVVWNNPAHTPDDN